MLETSLTLSGVYYITCLSTNYTYVGSTNNFKERIRYHRSQLTRNCHHSKLMQRDFNKYGEQNFLFSPLWICPVETCKINEQIFLNKLGTGKSNNSYNSRKHAIVQSGYNMTEEAKLNYSKAQTKKWQDPEYRARVSAAVSKSLTGKKLSPEHAAKCRNLQLGKKQSSEQIEKKSKKCLVTTPQGIEICYFSIRECCRDLNLNQGAACACARGQEGYKTHKGYKFSYL